MWFDLPARPLLAVDADAAAGFGALRALGDGQLPRDSRLGALQHLEGEHPFQWSGSAEQWPVRRAELKRQILVSQGLWPLPQRTRLNAIVHGPVHRDGCTVERVILESFPGHFVTGSLYRPVGRGGKRPAVLCPHGHWPEGRFHDHGEAKVGQEIASGAERFDFAGRFPLQARCVQLARMGCVVFLYDMVGYADSVQMPHQPGMHRKRRGESDCGFFSASAEGQLQNIMGLQTWNSIRALDFLSALSEVDAARIGMTGASGGGTQTMILAAIDERIGAAVPAVMISTAMQGGCTCENAPYLRIHAGNIDIVAAIAPRPLALIGADDWTAELESKGLPDLQRLYEMLGVKDRVFGKVLAQFKHNYNSVSRSLMYHFFNRHLDLGYPEPIVESDFSPLSRSEATVWTREHPAPTGAQVGDEHERALLGHWTADNRAQIGSLKPGTDAFQHVVGGAWEVLIGRTYERTGEMAFEPVQRSRHRGVSIVTGLITNLTHDEQVPGVFLQPAETRSWNGQVALWLTDRGKAGLLNDEVRLQHDIAALIGAGYAVVGIDMMAQGEFAPDGGVAAGQRLVKPAGDLPWQAAPCFTFAYNPPLFSQRVHDALSTIRLLHSHARVKRIHLVGLGSLAGPVAAAARWLAANAIEKTAIQTEGFRFASVDRVEHPMFVPGAVKYGDVPALLVLAGARGVEVDESSQRYLRWAAEHVARG